MSSDYPGLPVPKIPRILVVHDEKNTLFLHKKELIDAGYGVTMTAKAAETLNHIETTSYVGQCWTAGTSHGPYHTALDCSLHMLEGVQELNERYRGMLMNNGNADLSKKDGLRQQVANAFGPDMQRLLVYFSLYENAFVEGALPSSVKHLIALAMAVGQRNSPGITYHANEALRVGATRDQIREAVTVAVLVGGAPSLLDGAEALAAVARFEAQRITSAGEPPLTGSGTHGECSTSSSEPEESSVSARGERQLRRDHR